MPRLFHTPDKFDCADAGTAASTTHAASARQAHLTMHTPRNLPKRRNVPIVIEGDRQSTVAPGMADSLSRHTGRRRVIDDEDRADLDAIAVVQSDARRHRLLRQRRPVLAAQIVQRGSMRTD